MTINIITNDADKAIVEFAGELDTVAAQGLAEKLSSVMTDAGKAITLDFSKLEYISSAGMRVLLQLNKNAIEKGGNVSITGMSEDILQIFQLVGFDKLFSINQ
ncbi:MAG: STAS domain-containing protein [Bacteroidales bacterium]|nr:STAS domain-containing protein [Bacteroidales bacterium]